MHVLPQGFHRSRHDGLLTSPTRAGSIARIRALLRGAAHPIDAIEVATTKPEEPKAPGHPCPCCASRMRIIETFMPRQQPRHHHFRRRSGSTPHDDNLRAIAPEKPFPRLVALLAFPRRFAPRSGGFLRSLFVRPRMDIPDCSADRSSSVAKTYSF
jgi:hypothetical protein